MTKGGLAWNIAKVTATKLGGRVLDGVVDRHAGVNVGLSDTLNFAGGAVVPMIAEAYARQPEDTFVNLWERRARWTLGLAAAAAAFGGAGYAAYRMLKRAEPPAE